LNLGKKFRTRILAGHAPALTDPDVHQGQVIEIERGFVWLTVLHRAKADVWAYRIRDDRPRLLAAGARAGDGHGYTNISARAMQREERGAELEAVDADELKRQRLEADQRWAKQMREEQAA
jgi:hypothetical protein